MTDRRMLASNGRVAASELSGQTEATEFVAGHWTAVDRFCVDLCRSPDGPRDRQLGFGDRFRVLERRDGWAFGQADRDGYVGYLREDALGPDRIATHTLIARSSHIYSAEDIKSPEITALSFGARLTVAAERKSFFQLDTGGFVPKRHLRPADRPLGDPATAAQLFYGTPYLWGGNSALGIDCSGLIQAAHLACAIACPGDSDQQEQSLGAVLPPQEPLARGDLLFWKGHVAICVDGETILHANANDMAVAYEPLKKAVLRIEAQGGGPVTSQKRVQR